MEYLDQNGIHYVPQQKNPQNCPQARPVQTLWSILEQNGLCRCLESKKHESIKEKNYEKIKRT